MIDLSAILDDARTAIKNTSKLIELDQVKSQFLGKKGLLTEQLKQLGQLPPEERPKAGQAINEAKGLLLELIETQAAHLQKGAIAESLKAETIDVTLPGRVQGLGSLHPVTLTRRQIESFFVRAGFVIAEGLEIEDEFHNFEALNIPKHHPARAMHDTFYVEAEDAFVLRTHTSSVQIRKMEEAAKNNQLPLRLIAPGRVYRCDSDMTHTPMFHQVEALVVDEHSSFADLKALLQSFMDEFFQERVLMRFRPSYFPFTEPSAEVDIRCVFCTGTGCRVCKETGWLEVLGCGMIHSKVLRQTNINPEKYSGFAFGMGMDRMAMLRYRIPDLRMLFENGLRFLEQFA